MRRRGEDLGGYSPRILGLQGCEHGVQRSARARFAVSSERRSRPEGARRGTASDKMGEMAVPRRQFGNEELLVVKTATTRSQELGEGPLPPHPARRQRPQQPLAIPFPRPRRPRAVSPVHHRGPRGPRRAPLRVMVTSSLLVAPFVPLLLVRVVSRAAVPPRHVLVPRPVVVRVQAQHEYLQRVQKQRRKPRTDALVRHENLLTPRHYTRHRVHSVRQITQ